MKKVLLTLIVSLAFCGSIFAQPESHWSDFNLYDFEQHGDIVAAVSIDGNMVGPSYENYNEVGGFYVNYDYEVAAFVNNVCRGHGFLCYYDGDDYATTNMMCIYYDPNATDTGVEVTFKLYDHVNEVEYVFCTSSQPILTGEDYTDYWDGLVYLHFSSSFTKEIDPYSNEENVNNGWYLISSPLNEAVNAEDVIGLRTPEFDFYSFNQSAEDGLEWINHKDEATYQLQPGVGYLYANSTGEDLTFVGAPYEGDGQVTLVKEDNVEFSGWNLVGNPFAEAATIDRSEFYVMKSDGTEIIAGEGNTVGAMEGIFVVAAQNGESVTFSKEPAQAKGQIVLNVTNNDRGNTIDRAIVRFGQGGVLPKFMLNENNTKMYIAKDNKEFAVVRSNKNGRVLVNFEPAEDGIYTISVDAQNVEVRYLHLIDHQEGVEVNLLTNPTYRFEAKTNGKPGRFELVFKTGTDIHKEKIMRSGNSEEFGFFSDGSWIINNEGDAILQVVDLNGQILSSEEISGCVSKHIEAAPGVYMLRLINGKDMKVQKVVVK